MAVESSDIVSRLKGASLTGLTWVVTGLFFFPVFWMAISGFKTEKQANGDPVFFFAPTLDQFREVTQNGFGTTFWPSLLNSLIIVLLSTLLVMLMAIPAAFALSIRPVAKWKDFLFFFISTKFLPVVASILPLYVIALKLGSLNSHRLLIILYTSMNLPLAIWMLRSFFREVPKELIEASQIDGADLWTQMKSVVLPIVAPGMAATGLLCFIFAWNEFFLAIQLNNASAETIPVWVSGAVDSRGQFLARLSAASTLATFPVVIAGWVAQKRMIRGLAMGAIK